MPAPIATKAPSPSNAETALRPGMLIDRYELLTPLAEGGMAVVWLARVCGSFGFEKLVALKTIRPNFAQDRSYHRMFLDESRIAGQVRHQNVVEILDVGIWQGAPYQVLEWIDGDSLAALHRVSVRKKKLINQRLALKITAQVCAGLAAAHELTIDGKPMAVVHRDVSPQNVLVSQAGHVKLIDFGIAHSAQRLAEDTRAGMIKGKLSYISPEQAQGLKADHRADIWACGAMLFQLLFGRTPRRSREVLGGVWDIDSMCNGVLGFTLDPEIKAVLTKALAPNREERYQCAREMEVALEQLAQRKGPITAAHMSRALNPLREQRAARNVVIEGALAWSRERAKRVLAVEKQRELALKQVEQTSLLRKSKPHVLAESDTQLSIRTGEVQDAWAGLRASAKTLSRALSKSVIEFSEENYRRGIELWHSWSLRRQLSTAVSVLGMTLCTSYLSGYQKGATQLPPPPSPLAGLGQLPLCQVDGSQPASVTVASETLMPTNEFAPGPERQKESANSPNTQKTEKATRSAGPRL